MEARERDEGEWSGRFVLLLFWVLAWVLAWGGGWMGVPAEAAAAERAPVHIGLDAEFGHTTSTSDDAIRAGILVAIEEINRAGGVLGGRPLVLLERDNRSVPARGVANLKRFAEVEDLVAVFCGKFSPVVIEALPLIHRLGLPLLDPWAAANPVVDNGYTPNYVFRLSLRDSWAIPTMIEHLRAKGARNLGLLVPNTAWGRSSAASAREALAADSMLTLVGVQWYNWGDVSLVTQYQRLLGAGMDGLLLVANESEGAVLVKEMALLPEARRVVVASHWGITGGRFTELAGPALERIDFAVVQTYSFIDAEGGDVGGAIAERVSGAVARLLGVEGRRAIVSPVGVAHAYDLTHLLARAVERAGSTDRGAVRDALERLGPYSGLVKHYERPFTARRHEALAAKDSFMARFAEDGALLPLR